MVKKKLNNNDETLAAHQEIADWVIRRLESGTCARSGTLGYLRPFPTDLMFSAMTMMMLVGNSNFGLVLQFVTKGSGVKHTRKRAGGGIHGIIKNHPFYKEMKCS